MKFPAGAGLLDGREDSLDPRACAAERELQAPCVEGPAYSSGPWPSYYLINFILFSQYSSFPKAVLSIRVTIQRRAVTPLPMKSDWVFGAAPCPPLQPSFPSPASLVAFPHGCWLRCH